MGIKTTFMILITVLALAGCEAQGGPNQQSGGIVGGVLGGVLGHQVGKGHGQTAATIVGVLIGASIGSNIGKRMDDVDRMKMATALETSKTGTMSSWKNPDTTYEYQVTPTRTYESQGEPCREYTLDAIVGGKKQQVYGTACRQADGNWKIVN